MQQNTEQVEELLGRADAAREDDDAVTDADEGFQTFLDVRQDHQLVDDRVRRLGGDDARLGQPQIAAANAALFGVGNGGALHRPLHHARTAAGADIQAAQAQLMADALAVLVLFGADRVAAPAHHHVRLDARTQRAGVAQQMKDVVGNALGSAQIDARAAQFALGIDDVAQRAEEHLAGAGDHLAIDEGIGRRIEQLEAYAAILLQDSHLEVLIGFEDGLGVIDARAGVEDCQGTLAEQLVRAAGTDFAQLLYFALRQGFQAAFGGNRGVDYVALGHW